MCGCVTIITLYKPCRHFTIATAWNVWVCHHHHTIQAMQAFHYSNCMECVGVSPSSHYTSHAGISLWQLHGMCGCVTIITLYKPCRHFTMATAWNVWVCPHTYSDMRLSSLQSKGGTYSWYMHTGCTCGGEAKLYHITRPKFILLFLYKAEDRKIEEG